VAGQRVYFGSADGRVYALALDSGDLVWKHDTGGGISASPAVAQGRLVIGNENGVLYCFGK
jgi:outer membrane protein assembly factor BamB